MRFTLKAPASSANLGPGFDTIGLALDIWNTVTIDTDGMPGEVTNTGTEAPMLDGRENLTLSAMRMLAHDVHRELPEVEITADTRIPVSRGLGSSAAAGLTVSFAPMTSTTDVASKSSLISSISRTMS